MNEALHAYTAPTNLCLRDLLPGAHRIERHCGGSEAPLSASRFLLISVTKTTCGSGLAFREKLPLLRVAVLLLSREERRKLLSSRIRIAAQFFQRTPWSLRATSDTRARRARPRGGLRTHKKLLSAGWIPREGSLGCSTRGCDPASAVTFKL